MSVTKLMGTKYELGPSFAVSAQGRIRLTDAVSVKDFGAVGDGVADDTAAIQAALNAGLGPVYFPAGIYRVTSEIVIPDRGGIVGAGAFWKRRTGHAYSGSRHTVILYDGPTGATTCVVRASSEPVGTQNTSYSVASGNSPALEHWKARDFHINANNKAQFGMYVYRAGDQADFHDITAEKAVGANHVHLGCWAARFGAFGAYEARGEGAVVGWDIFGWASAEATCYAYQASFHTCNNGTDNTYVAGSGTDQANSGGRFRVGRGSTVRITSEYNYGRACVLSQIAFADTTNGPTEYILDYVEANATGPLIDYRSACDAIVVRGGFIHPGNNTGLSPQDIKIVGANNSGTPGTNNGPANPGEWLRLENLHGDLAGTGFSIDSNTNRFSVINCSPFVQYSASRPGAGSFEITLEGANTAGTQTYTARTGYYKKDGNTVFVTGRVTLSALDANTAGRIRLSGLPFRVANYATHFGVVTIGIWNALTTSVIRLDGTLTAGNSYIEIYKTTAAGTSSLTDLLKTDLTNTSLIQFSAVYLTDA